MSDMRTKPRAARRVKIGATLDPDLVAAVERYIRDHPGVGRSAVIDDALRLWYARQQELALEAQYRAPSSDRVSAELRSWSAVRKAAARRVFRGR